MPRKKRELSSINVYHIVIKGVDRQIMFEEKSDYEKYLDILSYYKDSLEYELYAYCLMNNHVHLVIYTPVSSLESVFRHINTRYSVWFNMKYNRTGYLLQGRYHSEPINDYYYLFCAIRYVHRNPCNAGIEQFPGCSFKWTSFNEYIKNRPVLVNTDYILNLMGGIEGFLHFHGAANNDIFLDIQNIRRRLPDDVAKNIIEEITHCSTVTAFQSLSLSQKEKYINILHSKGISIRQLNRLIGMPIGIIQRILKK